MIYFAHAGHDHDNESILVPAAIFGGVLLVMVGIVVSLRLRLNKEKPTKKK